MDNYCEQLVQKRNSGAERARMVAVSTLILFSALLCLFFAIFIGWTFLLVAVVGLIALDIRLVSNMGVEYEYIVTNNELDVDKITGKRKRKRMITVDLSLASDFGEYPAGSDIEAQTTVHASTGLERDVHYLIVQHGEYGRVKVIFNPNEQLREAIVQELPGALRARLRNDVK